jgi:hypothetical protein
VRRDQEVRALLEAALKKLGEGPHETETLRGWPAPHARGALTAEAQQTGKYRIGYLSIAAEEHITHMLKSLEEALQERGYTADGMCSLSVDSRTEGRTGFQSLPPTSSAST